MMNLKQLSFPLRSSRTFTSRILANEQACHQRLLKQLNQEKIDGYRKNGYAVFHEIFDKDTISEVKERMYQIIDEADVSTKIATFSTENNNKQTRDDYFLDSAWQIKPFYEVDALDKNGKLIVPKHQAFNKVGHNMHDLDPVFEKFSYSKVMKEILFKVMNFKNPLVVQSMYIFKNSKVGGVVEPHKDDSYLLSNPSTCQGIWVGLDDAKKENGCLWGVPGSHLQPPKHKMKLGINKETGGRTCYMEPPEPEFEYSTEGAVPLEVEAGSIVLIHGRFTHFSEKNTSDMQRHAYTLHILEGTPDVQYDPQNWIQRPKDMPFRQVRYDV